MQRPATYRTKHGSAVLEYLKNAKDSFSTAAQIADHLRRQTDISRPTVYRQLGKLVREGSVRRLLLGGVSCFQYADPGRDRPDCTHLKCEVCNGIFDLQCGEVEQVSRHILESHAFQINESKTVFYGRCGNCRRQP